MSGTSPLSHTSSSFPNQHGPLTRTLAIIKPHAVKHRLAIEPRIVEAGFEIVKERQMAFHPDDENVHDLFGRDAHSLAGEPVWVYVLERRRAVEVWNSIMGDDDPAVAKINSPNSLRATYGESIIDNGFFGSADNASADEQISIIFASSPPFPPVEEADDVSDLPALDHGGSLCSNGSSVVSSLLNPESDDGSMTSNKVKVKAKPRASSFTARPAPASTSVPTIQPRMTRASALRAGVELPASASTRAPASAESIARTFANVPGHRRASTIAVASTAPPSIAPRATRASALRTGQVDATAPVKRARPSIANTFANVPGHKRTSNIVVASMAPPTIAPRPTRASALRTGKVEPAPMRPRPSSVGGIRSASFEGVPGHKRAGTIEVASTRPPATAPRANRSAMLRAQAQGAAPPSSFKKMPAPAAPPLSRRQSLSSVGAAPRPRVTASESSSTTPRTPATPARAPLIAPRTNKSALLRAAKLASANGTSNKPTFISV